MEQLAKAPAISLQPGEEPLWTGRPVPRFFDTSSKDLCRFGVLMLVFCMWLGVFIVGLTMDSGWLAMLPFGAVLSIFVALGLYLAASPVRLYRRLERTAYAITNQRVVVLQPEGEKSFPLTPDLLRERHLHPDGGGDLVFDFEETHKSNNTSVFRAGGLVHLAELQPVENLLNRLIYGTAPAAYTAEGAGSTLEREAREYLHTCLLPGETLLWAGRPQPKLFRGQGTLLIITAGWFAIIGLISFVLLAGTPEDATVEEGSLPGWFNYLFLAPFHLAGLILLIAPFYEHGSRRREVYGITDKRYILAHAGGDGFRHSSIPLNPAAKRTLTLHSDGTGDISFLHRGQTTTLHELPSASAVDALISGMAK